MTTSYVGSNHCDNCGCHRALHAHNDGSSTRACTACACDELVLPGQDDDYATVVDPEGGWEHRGPGSAERLELAAVELARSETVYPTCRLIHPATRDCEDW